MNVQAVKPRPSRETCLIFLNIVNAIACYGMRSNEIRVTVRKTLRKRAVDGSEEIRCGSKGAQLRVHVGAQGHRRPTTQ